MSILPASQRRRFRVFLVLPSCFEQPEGRYEALTPGIDPEAA